MINKVRGIKQTKDYLILELNNAIELKINKKPRNGGLDLSYGFNPGIITAAEAKEIVEYFVAMQNSEDD